MKYSITWNDNNSLVVYSGDISKRDLEHANADVHGDNRTYKLLASIWDFTKCNMQDIKPEDLHYTIVVDLGSSKTIKNHKIALVVVEPHSIRLCETYINKSIDIGSPWDFMIFNSLDGIDEWINA